MFNLIKYRIKDVLRSRDLMFWQLAFPLVMVFLFYFSFGRNFEEAEQMSNIPVAAVNIENSVSSEVFYELLEELDGELLEVVHMDLETAEDKLDEGEVRGIFLAPEDSSEFIPTLIVARSGIYESILEMILDTFMRSSLMIQRIATDHPEYVASALDEIQNGQQLIQETSLGGRTFNTMFQTFFALIGMVSLYGCFLGADSMNKIQANLSALGVRRSITPTHKLKVVLSELIIMVLIQFGIMLIMIGLIEYLMGMELGGNWGNVLLIVGMSVPVGVSMGILVGSIGKLKARVKDGILAGTSMLLSFLGGLMGINMKDVLEQNAPIINRINPVAVISDAFHSLVVFDDVARFQRSLLILGLMCIIGITISFILIRRERYASI